MFGFWNQIEKYFDIDLVSGGVDIYASYGFLLGSWIIFNVARRIYTKTIKRK